MLRIVWPTLRWSKCLLLSLNLCSVALVSCVVLMWSTMGHAQTACSKSEALYNAASLANIKIFGKYVTLPPDPEWESLVPMYNQLKDHDTSVHLGECKAMMVVLKQKVIERVKKYATTLRVSIDDPLNRLQGKGRISLDGATVRQADAPTVILPGTHRVSLSGYVLQPGERLALTTELDGTTIGKGEANEIQVEIPRSTDGSAREHTVTFHLAAQHECRIRLNVSGNLLNRPKPGQPSFVVELSNQKLFTRQMLQKGDYPLNDGTYALTIKLSDGELPEDVQPRLLIDDAQIGLKPVSRDEIPTWQHTLHLGCEPGQSYGQSRINLGFSGEGGKPLLEADPDAVEPEKEDEKPSKPIPTLTWVGIGAVGVGAAVAIVSHFAIANPAQEEGDAVYEEAQCQLNGCTTAIEDFVIEQYNTRDVANGVAIGGIVLAGVGAVVGTIAWVTSEPPQPTDSDHASALGLRLEPVVNTTTAGARLIGTF
jgi:hypothetical protein